MNKNPAIEAIIKNAVEPAITRRKQAVEGTIQNVNYQNQTARVYWRDPDSGGERESEHVPLPLDGDGVFRQAAEAGDRVTMSFRNGSHRSPYITIIHKKARPTNYESKYGAGIPKDMGFL